MDEIKINGDDDDSLFQLLSVLVAQLVERPPGLPMCSQKECPTKFETRWLQEIPFSKELTDNYCALGLLFENITCNNNNRAGMMVQLRPCLRFGRVDEAVSGK